jgi:hypothetical protein
MDTSRVAELGAVTGFPRGAASQKMVFGTAKQLMVALLVALTGAASAAPVYALTTKQDLGLGLEPAMAVDGTNVYVVWRSLDGAVSGFNDVFLRRSGDDGQSFAPQLNVSSDVENSHNPVVAASGPRVYVAWENHGSFGYDVYFRASGDGAVSFGPTLNLSLTAQDGEGLVQYPQISATGNNVYVVWQDYSLGNYETFFRRSTDGGASFEPTVNLSDTPGDGSVLPRLSLDGSSLYVVWGESGLRVRRSDDGGDTFTPTYVPGAPANARLAFSGSSVYAAWMQIVDRVKSTPSNIEVFFARSADDGLTFGAAVNLSRNRTQSRYPHVVASGTNVYVGWQDDASTKTLSDRTADLFVRRSTDAGATFEAASQATDAVYCCIDNVGEHDSFDLAATAGTLYLVWFEHVPNTTSTYKVYFSRGP